MFNRNGAFIHINMEYRFFFKDFCLIFGSTVDLKRPCYIYETNCIFLNKG